jgi:hypothetical protein
LCLTFYNVFKELLFNSFKVIQCKLKWLTMWYLRCVFGIFFYIQKRYLSERIGFSQNFFSLQYFRVNVKLRQHWKRVETFDFITKQNNKKNFHNKRQLFNNFSLCCWHRLCVYFCSLECIIENFQVRSRSLLFPQITFLQLQKFSFFPCNGFKDLNLWSHLENEKAKKSLKI